MNNDTILEFYRGEGVRTVLRKYAFSADEKSVIHAAMITAKKDRPNMALISKADALLKEVAQSREPIVATVDKKEAVRQMARAQSEYSLAGTATRSKKDAREGNSLILAIAGAVIIGFLVIQTTKSYQATWYIEDYGKHTYAEAQKLCKEKNDLLPTVAQMNQAYDEFNIFTKASEYLDNKTYWVKEEGYPMIYSIRDDVAKEPVAGEHYETRCLDDANSIF